MSTWSLSRFEVQESLRTAAAPVACENALVFARSDALRQEPLARARTNSYFIGMPRIALASALTGVLAPLGVMAETGLAWACPDCPTARIVGRAICANDMWQNVAITALPFAVFALVAALLHRLGRGKVALTRR
jgi:hypothetical protein